MLYAGSLVTVMERGIVPLAAKHGLDVQGEGKGSVELANLIRAGLRFPDVFISADPAVIDSLMGSADDDIVSWYAIFATTRLVVGYSPASPLAHDFAEVSRGRRSLLDVLSMPALRVGRTDPRLDPKGYRTIIAARLLERLAHRPGFATRLLGDDLNPAQIVAAGGPILVRLESGDLDAAFIYATESVARNVPFVELPKEANLGEASEAKTYATVSVTIDGKTHAGAPAAYALTIPNPPRKRDPNTAVHRDMASRFVALLLSQEGRTVLTKSGMTMLAHPKIVGEAAEVPSPLQSVLR